MRHATAATVTLPWVVPALLGKHTLKMTFKFTDPHVKMQFAQGSECRFVMICMYICRYGMVWCGMVGVVCMAM